VNTILSQQPGGGKAEKGSTISVRVVGRQMADVPGVVGQGRDAAQQKLEGAGFDIAVQERESSFDDEGSVIGQTPEGGTSVEVGSQVTITVGTGPSTVNVPKLYGNTPDQAAKILEPVGLKLGAVSRDYSGDVLEGGIMYQDPAPGQAVEPGHAVNVTVSLGPKQVKVPQVYGMALETAQQTLADAGFYYNTLAVEHQESAGTALSTDPAAGTLLDPGAPVTIYYSSGPATPTAAPQSNQDQSADRAPANQSADRAPANQSADRAPANQGEGPAKGGKGGDKGNRGKGNQAN
jgi:eukaryotic-like serine/threonine-protein kinase